MRTQSMTGAVLTVLATVGLAYAAPGALQPPEKPRMTSPKGEPAQSRSEVFVAGKKILGLHVKNAEDKSLGTVDDMIIDRGSGNIEYLVLKSGAVLGMGGKLVTVPYASFGWDQVEKHVTLAATPEEIKAWPEFEKKRWMDGPRASDSYIRTIGKDYYDSAHSPWPLQARGGDATTHVKGTVKTITHHTVDGGRDELVVVVSSPDQRDREIVLGPSWYIGGNNSIALYRDAPIEVDVFQTDRSGGSVAVARTARVNGRELTFYDAQGRPMWNPESGGTGGDVFAAVPFVLLSEVKGKPVDCRGDKCGKVEDVVVECTTGRTVFLAIDPDKALLGIGDEDRLVPWSVMTRSPDGTVHLDATKAMVTSAPTSPKDLKTLADDNMYKRIYGVYDVPPMTLDGKRR
jgi:sporulation protein YlmC with PRC-barrel domain